MRVFWIFLVLAVLVLIPFLIWGEQFTEIFDREGSVSWLRAYGSWAWAAGLILLVLDLVLPLPSTVVMSALGYVYGAWWGGLLAASGSFLAGSLAYGLCRMLGRRAAVMLAGEKGLREGERLFARAGGWLVALSRWLPLLPEVVACMAGLTRMPARRFFAALACGCIPMGFAFAAVGETGNRHPVPAIALSILLPAVFWLLVQPLLGRGDQGGFKEGFRR